MVDSGLVFDTLFHALTYITVVIDANVKAGRKVPRGKDRVRRHGVMLCAVWLRSEEWQRRRSLHHGRRPHRQQRYWFRNDHRERVVWPVFDPLGNGYLRAWDWDQGSLRLCEIAGHEGEWSPGR